MAGARSLNRLIAAMPGFAKLINDGSAQANYNKNISFTAETVGAGVDPGAAALAANKKKNPFFIPLKPSPDLFGINIPR